MICSCPKCDVNIEIDLSRVPADGHYMPCPSCKSRFWAQKESFVNRAFKKDGKIYCINCDGELGVSHICSQCSTLLPDYCIIQKSKPPQRKKDSNLSFSFGMSSGGSKSSSHVLVRSNSVGKTKYLKYAVTFLVVAFIASSAFYINNLMIESTYVKNYVRALYGVKSGADLSINTFKKMSENIGYSLSGQELDGFNEIKADIDKRIALLDKTPKKYAEQQNKIKSLYSIYVNFYSLAVSPAALSSIEKATILESDFNKSSLDLRSSLTPELISELKNASVKYRNMGVFVD